ncbi:MAG: cytochrome c-type biogenesis protein [Wenzhouxiangellaceae bacterium]|nr:cytochrome c-type biogenesis protein [Wenzhouxiangellaceae bacterium]
MRSIPKPVAAVAVLWISVFVALPAVPSAFAQSAIEPRDFDTTVQEQRYRSLLGELRCTVCQNEPLESSNAELAAKLRDQVYAQIIEGRSDTEIRQYMRDRYGDFVLYDPPFAAHTLILWLGPIALLLLGVVIGALMIRQRRRMLVRRAERTDQ